MTESIPKLPAPPLEPYRLFFPLGLLGGILGPALWPLAIAGLPVTDPARLHADFMVGAFITLFACGFLMTAIPKMTFTPAATSREVQVGGGLAIALIAALTIAVFFPEARSSAHVLQLALLVQLVVFIARRFQHRKKNPPPAFLFIGSGLVFAVLSALVFAIHPWSPVHANLFQLARVIFHHVFLPSLVIGVGQRLLPPLMGRPLPSVSPSTFQSAGLEPRILFLALLFVSSSLVEVWVSAQGGQLLRAAVVLWIAVHDWKLYTPPSSVATLHAWCVWNSALAFTVGSVAGAVFSNYHTHLSHLSFIAGLGLVTLMVATRVTLAHGNHAFALERSRPFLVPTLGAMLLAAVLRATAVFLPQHYFLVIQLSVAFWTLALIMWGINLLPKIIRSAP